MVVTELPPAAGGSFTGVTVMLTVPKATWLPLSVTLKAIESGPL